MSKQRLQNGTRVFIKTRQVGVTYNVGDEGVVIRSMWDHPSWDYFVEFTTGKLAKTRRWVYDINLQELLGDSQEDTNSGYGGSDLDNYCGGY